MHGKRRSAQRVITPVATAEQRRGAADHARGRAVSVSIARGVREGIGSMGAAVAIATCGTVAVAFALLAAWLARL
jgi:hypothetical protein